MLKLSTQQRAKLDVLREQLSAASSEWPNVESIFISTPEAFPPFTEAELPVDLSPQCMVGFDGPNGELHCVGGSDCCLDTPAHRYRKGFAGMMVMRQAFGVVGDVRETHDLGNQREYQQRWETLAAECGAILAELPTELGLGSGTYPAWQGSTRWQIALHELANSRNTAIGRHSTAELIQDIFMASAMVLANLLNENDAKSDKQKKSEKTLRPLTMEAKACIRIYKQTRREGDKTTMKQVVKDYVEEKGGSTATIMRCLSDNPNAWKKTTQKRHKSDK